MGERMDYCAPASVHLYNRYMLSPDLIDIGIILILALYVLAHMRDGFLPLTAKLVSFIGAAVLAFITYERVSGLVAFQVTAPLGILEAIIFLLLFVIFQSLIRWVLWSIFSLIPEDAHRSRVSQLLATVPAFLDGLILVSLILFLFVVMPFFPSIKRPIEESRIGGVLLAKASGIEVYLDQIFGQAAQESLGFLTVKPGAGEFVELPFQATKLSVDPEAEVRMLELVNAERAKVGAPPLVIDQTLVEVARDHSEDMWKRSYFAHTNPDGEDPFDRMRDGGAEFRSAGENLALARTVGRAHEGLMNSPGHKRNILDPSFGRIGIGVTDGGIYGKMFTQNFAD